MANSARLKAALILLVLFNAGKSEIITKPKDFEAFVGDRVYLNCSSSVPGAIQWFFYGRGGEQDRSIIYGYDTFYGNLKERARMEKNEAAVAYNLIIESVTAADAGKYECQEDVGRGAKSFAQLIILDSEPVCQSNIDTNKVVGPNGCGIESSPLVLSCVVTFHGNEAPIMQWNKTGNASVTGRVEPEITGNHATYTLSMTGDPSMNNAYYTCNTTRSLSANRGCKSNVVKIIGTKPDAMCASCKVYSDAIFCFFLIILPIAVVVAIATTWYYLYRRYKRAKSRKQGIGFIFHIEALATLGQYVGLRGPGKKYIEVEKKLVEPKLEVENIQIEEPTKDEDESSEQEMPPVGQHVVDVEVLHDSKKRGDEIGPYVNKIKQLQEENEHLKREVQSLEYHVYTKDSVEYPEKLKLVHTIVTKAAQEIKDEKKTKGKSKIKGEKEGDSGVISAAEVKGTKKSTAVNGIAVLGTELFVLNDARSEVEVYDTVTFKYVRGFEVKDVQLPLDIASSLTNKSLYVINRRANDEGNSQILRCTTSGEVLTCWQTDGGDGRLSTYGSNVIVCLFNELLISEYLQDGKIIRTVRLSPGAGFSHPWHAIKVGSNLFVVSHGDVKDSLHRVCVVNTEGAVVNAWTNWEKKHVKVPVYLVHGNDRCILVADRDQGRILLLSSALHYKRKLLEDKELSHLPTRLCFDEAETRLFVVTNKIGSDGRCKEGRVLIFNTKE